jgi:NCS1 family nucleobase:cation symporter-1
VDDLYRRNGAYEYAKGFNLSALWALAAGITVALIGVFVPSLALLYRYAWFVGFLVSALVYFTLMSLTGEKTWPSPKQQSPAQAS